MYVCSWGLRIDVLIDGRYILELTFTQDNCSSSQTKLFRIFESACFGAIQLIRYVFYHFTLQHNSLFIAVSDNFLSFFWYLFFASEIASLSGNAKQLQNSHVDVLSCALTESSRYVGNVATSCDITTCTVNSSLTSPQDQSHATRCQPGEVVMQCWLLRLTAANRCTLTQEFKMELQTSLSVNIFGGWQPLKMYHYFTVRVSIANLMQV